MKDGGLILWISIPICDMSETPWSMVEYHPISARDQTTNHRFGKKVFPWIFLDYVLVVGRIWKGDILIADLEDLEKLDASNINAKEVLIRQNDDFISKV